MKEKISCLQLKIGECGGCQILSIAIEKRSRVPRSEEPTIIKNINSTYCAPETTILIEKRPEPPIWQV